jgi:flavin-dependent dehydrogenase
VPREDFDNLLAEETAKKGGELNFNSTVQSIKKTAAGFDIAYQKENKTHLISAKYIIDASGNAKVMAKAMNIPISEIKTNRRTLFTRVVDEKASLIQKSQTNNIRNYS